MEHLMYLKIDNPVSEEQARIWSGELSDRFGDETFCPNDSIVVARNNQCEHFEQEDHMTLLEVNLHQDFNTDDMCNDCYTELRHNVASWLEEEIPSAQAVDIRCCRMPVML